MSENTSADFPVNWRYNPLRWDAKRETWVNAIAYKSDERFSRFGEFEGCDLNGTAYFRSRDGQVTDMVGIPCVKNGIPAVAETPGMAVGIFLRHCAPELVAVDCDSDPVVVTNANGSAGLKTKYGRNELIELFRRRGEAVPYTVGVRGNRDNHGYLIFRQNPLAPIRSRNIKPYKLSFDVLGAGHQVHWTAPGRRALLQGAELLENPTELPLWFAQMFRKHQAPAGGRVGGGAPVGNIVWEAAGVDLVESILAPVDAGDGAWNQRLFKAACQLFELVGMSLDEALELILERCGPVSDGDRSSAIGSVHSAYSRTVGEGARG